MIVKLLTEHHSEFPSLNESCTDSYEYPQVKVPHCWKSHAGAHLLSDLLIHAHFFFGGGGGWGKGGEAQLIAT